MISDTSYIPLAVGTALIGISLASTNNQKQFADTATSIANAATDALAQNPEEIFCAAIGTAAIVNTLTDYTNASYLRTACKRISIGVLSAISSVGIVTLFKTDLPQKAYDLTSTFLTEATTRSMDYLDQTSRPNKMRMLTTGGLLASVATMAIVLNQKAKNKKIEEANQLFKLNSEIESAEKGDRKAFCNLYNSFLIDHNLTWKNVDFKAQSRIANVFKQQIQKLAKIDEGRALVALSNLFFQGVGFVKNYNTANVCIVKAAKLGHTAALENLTNYKQNPFNPQIFEDNNTSRLIDACLGKDLPKDKEIT